MSWAAGDLLNSTNLNTKLGGLNWVNVKEHGALGDGITNDFAAINAAITAATSQSVIFFPAGVYQISGSIDLTGKSHLHFVGVGTSATSIDDLGTAPQVRIRTSSTTDAAVIVSGFSCHHEFENFVFEGALTGMRISDASLVSFHNCSFKCNTVIASNNNTALLLENTFLASFTGGSATAVSNTKYSVILRGKTPFTSVDATYLLTFDLFNLELGGIKYEQNVLPTLALCEHLTFTNCITELLGTGGSFFELAATNAASNTPWRSLYFNKVVLYDSTGSPPLFRVSDATTGTNIHGFVAINCKTPNNRIIQVDAGAPKFLGVTIVGARLGNLSTDSVGNPYNQLWGRITRDTGWDYFSPSATTDASYSIEDAPAFRGFISNETSARFGLDNTGTHAWGPGGGDAFDLYLQRSAASTLALSGGTLNLRNAALSLRTTSSAGSSSALTQGEICLVATSTTSAQLAFRSGATTYLFNADGVSL